MDLNEITALSNFLNTQANLPVVIQKIADMLKEELATPISQPEESNG